MASTEEFLAVAGLALAAAVLLLQQSGIPIPIPAPLIVITMGLLAALGYAPLPLAFLTMLLALVIGGAIQYYLRRGGGKPRSERYGKDLGAGAELLGTAEKQIRRRGWLAIALGVALPVRRNAMIWAAGLVPVPFARFLLGLAVGCAIYVLWNFLLSFVGVAFIAELRNWTRTQIFLLALALGVGSSLLRWQFHLNAASESMSALRDSRRVADESKLAQ